MRNVFFLLIGFLVLFTQGCEESFNPYTTFKQNYGVACILRSDTTFQIATVLKSYLSDESNLTDPKLIFEKDADVRLWYGDSVYRLKDTILVSGNSDSIECYTTNKFKIENNKHIEIEVLLTNGKRLKAISQTPSNISFKNTSEVIIPPVGKDVVQVFWNQAGNENFYQARLLLKCEIVENGVNKVYYKALPKTISVIDGITQPNYPQPSKSASIAFSLDAISWYLQSLSDSLNNTASLSIHRNLVLEVITFDTEVSRYISVSNSTTENLSIRFDEGEYSNISGGLGIFGSQIITKYSKLRFLENYIRSFGFNFIYDN
jgi:hypothetical protein